jgi:hypothetical protein
MNLLSQGNAALYPEFKLIHMKPETNNSIFDVFIKNSFIFYLLLILFGYLTIYLYYNIFNIDIYNYFSLEDYLNLFFRNLILVIVIASTFTLIFYLIILFGNGAVKFLDWLGNLFGKLFDKLFYKWKKKIKSNEESNEESNDIKPLDVGYVFRLLKNIALGVSVLFEVFNFILYLNDHRYTHIFDLTMGLGMIISIGVLVVADYLNFGNLRKIKKSQQIIIFFIILAVYSNYSEVYSEGIELFYSNTNEQNMV